MATGYNVRVGDADREAVAAQLREHFADGRLTLEELNERLDQAFAAKTKADLNTVLRDLPQAARPATGLPYGGTAWQGPAWPGPMATRPGQDYGNGWGGSRQPRGSGAFAPLMGMVWLFVILGSVILFGGLRWRQAAGARLVPRGTCAGQAADRDGQAARLPRAAWSQGPQGAPPLVILATCGFRAGSARLIVEG